MSRFDLKGNKVLRYSGLATQFFISLAIAAYAGRWLDRKLEFEKPLMTALLTILMLFMLLVWLNYDLKRTSK